MRPHRRQQRRWCFPMLRALLVPQLLMLQPLTPRPSWRLPLPGLAELLLQRVEAASHTEEQGLVSKAPRRMPVADRAAGFGSLI